MWGPWAGVLLTNKDVMLVGGAGKDGGKVERKGRMSQGVEDLREGKITPSLIKCTSVEWPVLAGS